MLNQKYTDLSNELRNFNYKEASIEDIENLRVKVESFEKECSSEASKLDAKIEMHQSEIDKKTNELKEAFPNISDFSIDVVDSLIDSEISNIHNLLS